MIKTMSDRFTLLPVTAFILIPSLVIAFSGLSIPVQVHQTGVGKRQQQQQLPFTNNNNDIIGNSQFAMINECRQRLDIIAKTTTSSTQLYSAQSPPDDTPKPITSESISQSSSSLSSDTDSSTEIDGTNNNNIVDDVDNTNSGGISRTVLLALPLFFKFAIVLIIKFLTDLVVFPLLFAWRGCRIGKRKLLRLFGIVDTSDTNKKTKQKNNNNKDSFDPDLRLNGDGI